MYEVNDNLFPMVNATTEPAVACQDAGRLADCPSQGWEARIWAHFDEPDEDEQGSHTMFPPDSGTQVQDPVLEWPASAARCRKGGGTGLKRGGNARGHRVAKPCQALDPCRHLPCGRTAARSSGGGERKRQ